MSDRVLKQVKSRIAEGAVMKPTHASEGVMPWNAMSIDEVAEIKAFIRNYASVHGLPQPAAPRGHNKPAPKYLPCATTKKDVHTQYSKAGGAVAYTTFVKVWNRDCADVIIMKPKEDVCGTCSDLQSSIARARTEEQRLQLTESLRTHILLANSARDSYRECIEKAKTAIGECVLGQPTTYQHLTFDFAQ